MPQKFTMLFNFGGVGFSESWYYLGGFPGAGLPLLSGDFKKLADARALMSGKYVNLVGVRLSDVSTPRLTAAQFVFAKFEGTDFPDVASNAWMAMVRGQANRGRRQLWLRGIPDDQIAFDPGTQRFLPQGALANALDNYQKILKSSNFAIRVVQSAAAAGAANIPINAIVPGTSGGSVKLVGAVVADDTKPQIVSGFKRPLGFLNGTYMPRTGYVKDNAGIPPSTILLNRALSTFQSLGYAGGASIRPQVFEYIDVGSVALQFPRERKTGRAFFVQRGRRSRAR